MLIQKFVEVPNTNIQEEVLSDFGYDLCYDMAQQYGHAQLVWYALNGTRVVRVSTQTGINPVSPESHSCVREYSSVGGCPAPVY